MLANLVAYHERLAHRKIYIHSKNLKAKPELDQDCTDAQNKMAFLINLPWDIPLFGLHAFFTCWKEYD